MNEMLALEKQKSQSGQALVEYVLLLVIAIALVLGLANQFYKPFGNWVQNQMGPYLECLLDVGELPALGSDSGGECTSNKFVPGRPKGSPNPNNLNSKPSDGPPPDGKNKNQSSSESSSSSSSTAASGSGGGRNGRNQGFKIGGPRGADGAANGNFGDQVMTEKLPQSKFFKFRSSSNLGFSVQSQTLVSGLDGTLPPEKRNGRERATSSTYKAGNLDQSEIEGKPQRLIIKPGVRKISAEAPEEAWSFAKYVKFALILLIVVAVILFLAGQFSQISKSMEK